MSDLLYHKALNETQWNRIKCLFEKPKKVGRPSLNPRKVFNGILWILRSGSRWRDLPSRYGNWNSIYHKESGLFELLLRLVNTDAQTTTLLEIDSTFCKVHQSACSALKNQAIGVSRGGKNTKVHVLINERMQLLKVVLTGGQIHDSEPVFDLFDDVELVGKTILADKAYSSESIRNYLEERGAQICIPDKVNFKVKHAFDAELYKRRNLVERFFNALRIIATSLLVMTNWLFAFSILFYLPLPPFIFNLPTAPKIPVKTIMIL